MTDHSEQSSSGGENAVESSIVKVAMSGEGVVSRRGFLQGAGLGRGGAGGASGPCPSASPT